MRLASNVSRFLDLQGAAVSVAYAVRHPERVSHLVLWRVRTRRQEALSCRKRKAHYDDDIDAPRMGRDNPSFRQMFTGVLIPGATHEQADIFNELQRRTTSPECAARYFDVVSDFDITDLLAEVKAPTLVMHARGDLLCQLRPAGSWRLAFPAPASSPSRARTICSCSMSRLPIGSSKRSDFFLGGQPAADYPLRHLRG